MKNNFHIYQLSPEECLQSLKNKTAPQFPLYKDNKNKIENKQGQSNSYYGIYRDDILTIMCWNFFEQKFNRGGQFCCRIRIKYIEENIQEQELEQLLYLLIDFIKNTSNIDNCYKWLILIDENQQQIKNCKWSIQNQVYMKLII